MLFGNRTGGTQRKPIKLKAVVSVMVLGLRKSSDIRLGKSENHSCSRGKSAFLGCLLCQLSGYYMQAKKSTNKKAPKPQISLIS